MIHPTAVVVPGSKIGHGVEIGPYSVVEADVELGDDVRLGPRVTLLGHTRIGSGTKIHAGAVIGDEPQDLHFEGAESYTEIGRNCILREYVTVHRGAKPGTATTVGDHVMLMAFAHLGHNCRLGNNVVVANATLLGGHVEVGDGAFISARVLVHQFCRIGVLAMIGGGSGLNQDVPPFCMFQLGGVRGPNLVGMRRQGIDAAARLAVKGAVKTFFFSGLNRLSALERMRALYGSCPQVQAMIQFIETTQRGIVSGRKEDRAAGATDEAVGNA